MSNYDFVDVLAPKESGFDLSYSNKFTMDMGDMVPCFVQEVIPGDQFKAKAQFMVRMAPLANPIYTKVNAYINYFFVPNRILWDGSVKNDDWETFITGGKDGTLEPVPPHMQLSDIYSNFAGNSDSADGKGAQTLADYMGIPAAVGEASGYEGIKVNMLPFLAYQKIYDDWFRDSNITNSLFDEYEHLWMTGGDLYADHGENFSGCKELLKIRKRAWRKDYFTSALPWAQRGEDVHIPSGTLTGNLYGATGEGEVVQLTPVGSSDSVLGATIRDLRNASALQLWLEKNAISGARYIEQILAHFGVRPSDGRLQRAQYLGSVKSPVVISEVQSNASTTDEPLGKLGGKGVSYGNDFAFSEKFDEHGWIIGIMTIIPEASYCQGLNRCLTHRNEKLDYAFPEFAELGLQEINTSEIYSFDVNDYDKVFGYQERFSEYKSNYNQVHGLFRNPDQTLAQYNMTRFYERDPELSAEFIEVNEKDITSPFVDTEVNAGNYWVDLYNDIKAVRPLPKNSIPLM